MNKLLKSNKGFTLVEVIVVAVIVMVLAAVAIPLYNGYVQDSRTAALSNTAGAIAGTLGSAAQMGILSGTGTPATATAAGKIAFTGTSPMGNPITTEVLIPKGMKASIVAVTGGGTAIAVDYLTAVTGVSPDTVKFSSGTFTVSGL